MGKFELMIGLCLIHMLFLNLKNVGEEGYKKNVFEGVFGGGYTGEDSGV